jgi:hypothetical protein
MMKPGTHLQEFLDGLMQSEKDYLSDIAREAIDLAESDRTPAQDDRVYAIMGILRPALEAMVRDGYEGTIDLQPQYTNGRYQKVR